MAAAVGAAAAAAPLLGPQLAAQVWPARKHDGYVEVEMLERSIEASMLPVSGQVSHPDSLIQSFVGLLDAQLERVNAFVAEVEADVQLQWSALALPRTELGLEKTRSILSVLKTHMHRKCKAEPGKCSAFNRLKLEGGNGFAAFAVLYERTQNLRQLVSLNYLAFTKIMEVFEAKTGLAVKQAFTEKLQRSKFYNSPGVPRLVTEMDCVAKDLIMRADSHQPEDLREEFICGVCLDVLRNPVVLSCAHRFCWHCAASSCVSSSKCDDWACPICRKVQPVNQEVFTVNAQLQTFIQEHVVDSSAEAVGGASAPPAAQGPVDFDDLVRIKGGARQQQPPATAAATDAPPSALPPLPPPPSLPPPPPPPPSAPSPGDADKKSAAKAFAAQLNDGVQNDLNIGLRQPLPQKFVGRWLSLSDDFFAARDGAEQPGAAAAAQAAPGAGLAAAIKTSPPQFPPVQSSAEGVVALALPDIPAVPVPVPVAPSCAAALPVVSLADAVPAQSTGRGSKKAADGVKPKRKRGRPPADASLTAEERKLNRLKKNRIAAQRSYKKRVENTNKLESENVRLKAESKANAAALDLAQGQWRQYSMFVARHGLEVEAGAEGLLPPPQATVKAVPAAALDKPAAVELVANQ